MFGQEVLSQEFSGEPLVASTSLRDQKFTILNYITFFIYIKNLLFSYVSVGLLI